MFYVLWYGIKLDINGIVSVLIERYYISIISSEQPIRILSSDYQGSGCNNNGDSSGDLNEGTVEIFKSAFSHQL